MAVCVCVCEMADHYRISVVNCCAGPGSWVSVKRWSGSHGRTKLSRPRVCQGDVGVATSRRALPTEPPGRLTSWNQSPWPPLSTDSRQSHALFPETRLQGTGPSPWWPLPALRSACLCWSGPLEAERVGSRAGQCQPSPQRPPAPGALCSSPSGRGHEVMVSAERDRETPRAAPPCGPAPSTESLPPGEGTTGGPCGG